MYYFTTSNSLATVTKATRIRNEVTLAFQSVFDCSLILAQTSKYTVIGKFLWKI